MRNSVVILITILILFVSCEKEKQKKFSLDVKINSEYSGYLYISYNETKDSSLVENHKAHFEGTVSGPTLANFGSNNISASNRNFYLENKDILGTISCTKRKVGEYEIDWFTIESISGTATSILVSEFEKFKSKHENDKDWNNLLFKRLKKIISENQNNRYSGDLLSEITNKDILDKEQIRILYNELDLESQDSWTIKMLKSKAFPEQIVQVGDTIHDFSLPNKNNKLVNTKDFRGKLSLVDFWASWCRPCINEFPELIKINNDFKDKSFEILGVSVDENQKKWLKALENQKLQWENVIDTTGLVGEIGNKYGIRAIPYNVLVDDHGVVIANNLEPKNIRAMLDSLAIK